MEQLPFPQDEEMMKPVTDFHGCVAF